MVKAIGALLIAIGVVKAAIKEVKSIFTGAFIGFAMDADLSKLPGAGTHALVHLVLVSVCVLLAAFLKTEEIVFIIGFAAGIFGLADLSQCFGGSHALILFLFSWCK